MDTELPPSKRLKPNQETSLADKIAKLSYDFYLKLPKSGKPIASVEHTVLASIVQENQQQQQQQLRVVALATGTKCFPHNLGTRHEAIVDCHAESLLKRCFKSYLLKSIEAWLDLDQDLDRFRERVLDTSRYHLFVSQTPCGCVSRWQGDYNEHRHQDDSFRQFKHTGGVNRKPGRGPPCPKAGCIHKLAKWNLFGLQGKRLLCLTRKPVYFDSINIGNCEDQQERFDLNEVRAHLSIQSEEKEILQKSSNLFELPRSGSIEIAFASSFRFEEFVRDKRRPAASNILVHRLSPGVSIKSRVKSGDDTVANRSEGDSHDDDDGGADKLEHYSILIASHGRRLGATKHSCKTKKRSIDGDKTVAKLTDSNESLTGSRPTASRDGDGDHGQLTICHRQLHARLDALLLRVALDKSLMDSTQEQYDRAWLDAKRHLSIFRGWPE